MLKTRLTCLSIAGMVIGFAVSAHAVTTSDKPAGVLVWPKIVVDTSGTITDEPTDTVITLSNTSRTNAKMAHCFYVNATGHCSNDPDTSCFSSDNCMGGACDPGWNKVDFNIFITRDQPLGWLASDGLTRGELPIEGPLGQCSNSGNLCISNAQCPGGTCQIGGGQNNVGTAIPPVPDDPFIGSLTCIQFDPSVNPPSPDASASRNSLIGEADIVTIPDPNSAIDGSKYNAVGFRATGTGTDDDENRLQFGGTGGDYEGCAQTLFDHFFDGAIDPTSVGNGPNSGNGVIDTELTLIPCGNDLLSNEPGVVVAQFLVFNEFEQRFSASRTINCFLNSDIANLDTPNEARSIFNVGVSGTLVGQTRIQGVGTASTGRGLTGIAQMTVEKDDGSESGSAYSLDQNGNSSVEDLLLIP